MPDLELHPGVHVALARTRMNETDVAKAMAAGELTSPQEFANSHYFDIRLTGTGRAYRQGLREYVWRDPSIYLNQDFLDRCRGLPVILDHPDGEMLDSVEYLKRNIGSVVLPYVKGDEVWGIARILDAPAARWMREKQVSTSPAVVFSEPESDNEMIEVRGGRHLLIEGNPRLIDHVAICEEGVWDRGGPPTGVDSTEAKEGHMADKTQEELEKEREEKAREDKARRDAEETAKEEEEREKAARADAARRDEKIDNLLKGIKVLSDRMDGLERRGDRRRHDADPEEEAEHAEMAAELAEAEAEEAEEAARGDARHHDAARSKLDAARRRFDAACAGMRDASRRDAIKHRLDAAHKALNDAIAKGRGRDDRHRDDDEEEAMPWAECDRRDGEEDEEYSARVNEIADKHDSTYRKRDDESTAAHCDRVAKGLRRDRARRADRARMDSIDRVMDAVVSLSDRVDRLAQVTADRKPEDEGQFASARSRADSVYQAHGESAPQPLGGQSLVGYRIMLARGLQKHSTAWKDTDLPLIARTDPKAFANVEGAIYADAQAAAEAPYGGEQVRLWPIQRRLASGHTETTFKGHPLSWMSTFMSPGRTTTRLRAPDRR